MSDERAGFIRAILADKADNLPRLIFADWLDGQSAADDRHYADFIRAQIDLARLERPLLDGAILVESWPDYWTCNHPGYGLNLRVGQRVDVKPQVLNGLSSSRFHVMHGLLVKSLTRGEFGYGIVLKHDAQSVPMTAGEKAELSALGKATKSWLRRFGIGVAWRRGAIVECSMSGDDWYATGSGQASHWPIEYATIIGEPTLATQHDERNRRVIFSLAGCPHGPVVEVDMRTLENERSRGFIPTLHGPTLFVNESGFDAGRIIRQLFEYAWPGTEFVFRPATRDYYNPSQTVTVRMPPGPNVRIARVGDVVLSDGRGELVTLPENEVANLENAIDRAGRGQRLDPIGVVRAAAMTMPRGQRPYQELSVQLLGGHWGASPMQNIRLPNPYLRTGIIGPQDI